jgi:hypothetical protein
MQSIIPRDYAGLQRDGVGRERLAAQGGEGRPRVGEGVDPDAEPGDAVAAGDADQAEDQDRDHLGQVEAAQGVEVDEDHDADEDLEQEDELALRGEVGLAGLEDQLGDVAHRAVHRHVLELVVHPQPEEHAEDADDQAGLEQGTPVEAEERDAPQVGQLELGLAGGGGHGGQEGEQRHQPEGQLPQGRTGPGEGFVVFRHGFLQNSLGKKRTIHSASLDPPAHGRAPSESR